MVTTMGDALMLIYKITNLINNKVYIGQTVQKIHRRISQHLGMVKKINHPLYNSISKYGWTNFKVEVIDNTTSKKMLDDKEKYWIETLNALVPNGYNVHTGGNHHTCSKEVKQKLSIAHMGKKLSDDHKKHISEAIKGRHVSRSTKGRHLSQVTRQRMSIARKLIGTKPPSRKGCVPWNKGRRIRSEIQCKCGKLFFPRNATHRFCSISCGGKWKVRVPFTKKHRKNLSLAQRRRYRRIC